ncbi:alpha/beta fold hydrolase [Agromyces atrinae]|uniref:Alpha/beta hydrolase n=1 Tax=Agromyces atrinae TaxID=592376 RepID=A0A4Q2MBR3_9MICO|nr:alpha/beta hydrolase [Agromyces atrinae]NYD66161.1 pimeloyl-ACP methyl ester carboxylesterase [Agromyces atrinae]RXZ86500.1 alpha/beta hydrolase [Agromyces atrinae]
MSVESPYADLLDRIPVTERVSEVLGSPTHWWEYGEPATAEGTTLVVVHGFRGDHHGLEPVIAHLPGIHIVSPDLPGFGASPPLDFVAHDVDGYATWLGAFIDKLDSPGRIVVLGHSFGSIVVSAALSRGLDVTAAILVNPIAAPALAGPRGILTRLAVVYYQAATALPEKAGFALLRNRAIVRVMSVSMAKTRDKDLLRFIHDQHDRYFSAFDDRRVVLEAFRASVSHDASEYAAHVEVPVLLIAADRDDITPVEAQHRLDESLADSRLHVIDGVGHLIHYEKPAEAAEQIIAFLNDVAP